MSTSPTTPARLVRLSAPVCAMSPSAAPPGTVGCVVGGEVGVAPLGDDDVVGDGVGVRLGPGVGVGLGLTVGVGVGEGLTACRLSYTHSPAAPGARRMVAL